MPPRKKANPSSKTTSSSPSKKSNQGNPPHISKFGIQHFFDRHTQNILLTSQKDKSEPIPKCKKLGSISTLSDTVENPVHNPMSAAESDSNQVMSDAVVDESNLREGELKNLSKDAPPANLAQARISNVDKIPEISPETSKSLSVKRFKFSPGMVIKQSQDDGVEEVTWKISPVNEKLTAKSKNAQNVLRELANSSRFNSMQIQQCSQKKTSQNLDESVEKQLASLLPKAVEKPLVSMNKVGLKRVNPDQEMNSNTYVTSMTTLDVGSKESPFRTPPSLSFCSHKLVKDTECNEASTHLSFRHHKKALLELLDQVEDVISVENNAICGNEAHCSKVLVRNTSEAHVKAFHSVTTKTISTEKMDESMSGNFLVLEVSEKRKDDDSSDAQRPYKVLRLLNEQTGEERAANLWDEWFYCVIAPGDSINVIGQFNELGKCDVDHNNNFVIVHPEIMVSGTRVAASFSCPRRTVLDERLKSRDNSAAALIGTMLHQIFQAGLTKEFPTIIFLEEYAHIVLQRNIESLYACGVDENDVHKTLVEAIPKILNWIMQFKKTKENQGTLVDFGFEDGPNKLGIYEVIDIEEMAWAPKYGLKGMIDASVSVKVHSNQSELDEMIMPLEFKTGKPPSGQSSAEHRAQVILYTLLMSERYQKHVDSGLLFYLQSDQTQGISVQRSDLIGLIMRRNELANDMLKASILQQLPPMLRSPSMCKGCRHLSFCTIYHKVHGGTPESSGLGDLFHSHTSHLSSAHSMFLQHWDRLIDLEAKENELAKKEIWRSQNLKSPTITRGISSIILDAMEGLPHQKPLKEDRFTYQFVRKGRSAKSLEASDQDHHLHSLAENDLDLTLRSGDYVILSTETNNQVVARGVIRNISHAHISISFSKQLRLPGRSSKTEDLLQQVWRVDKDEFMTSFAVMRFNIVNLFLPDKESTHLRRMIVDLEAPRFDSGSIISQDPAISYIWSVESLNEDQRKAILKILTAKDYALILGMPGTGKTSTMVHAVKALLMRGTSILLTSYTNSAVDNLLLKLKTQGIDFVRIGRRDVVHEDVRGHCLSDIKNVEDIKIRLQQVKVVSVTCLGVTSPLLANVRFDVCIMDEAGQTTLPVSLGPLTFASTFVLVGDHYQLPPLVQSAEARENAMGISLFRRLSEAHPHAISVLQSQYRMCQGIMELSNALIYGNRLRCGSSEVASGKLKFSRSKWNSCWLEEALDPARPVIFVDTDKLLAFEVKDQKIVNNPVEARIIAQVVEALINNGINGDNIGIITPYNSQACLIRHATSFECLEIYTIDKFQGRDKDCILLSFVRSSENSRSCTSSLLGDWHRINVAITRAKKKLIMVGSCRTISSVPLLRLLIRKVEEQSGMLRLSEMDICRNVQLTRCSKLR